jgi:putative dehydrogenase
VKVTLVGLGSMGFGMAESLLRGGIELDGCDLDEAVLKKLAALGGRPLSSPAETAAETDALIVVVVNAAQVEKVLFGEHGAVAPLKKEAVVMVCSTVSPAFAKSCAEHVEALGLHYLDAPISGGAVKAAQGALSVMASGTAAAFSRARPVLEIVAETVHELGEEAGPGSAYKMINQLLAGVHIAAAAEAMTFGIKNGLDPDKLYEVITGAAGNSWMFENRVPRILSGDYSPHSAVEIFVKDLDIVLGTGRDQRFPLPIAAAANQLFTMAASAGMGELDDSAVAKVYEQLSDIELPEKDVDR